MYATYLGVGFNCVKQMICTNFLSNAVRTFISTKCRKEPIPYLVCGVLSVGSARVCVCGAGVPAGLARRYVEMRVSWMVSGQLIVTPTRRYRLSLFRSFFIASKSNPFQTTVPGCYDDGMIVYKLTCSGEQSTGGSMIPRPAGAVANRRSPEVCGQYRYFSLCILIMGIVRKSMNYGSDVLSLMGPIFPTLNGHPRKETFHLAQFLPIENSDISYVWSGRLMNGRIISCFGWIAM